jgi:hypothetical protein
MDTDTPATKFGSQPENKKSFTYDGPTDEEIRLRALSCSKDRLLSIVGQRPALSYRWRTGGRMHA